jgi:hypothetical protein
MSISPIDIEIDLAAERALQDPIRISCSSEIDIGIDKDVAPSSPSNPDRNRDRPMQLARAAYKYSYHTRDVDASACKFA